MSAATPEASWAAREARSWRNTVFQGGAIGSRGAAWLAAAIFLVPVALGVASVEASAASARSVYVALGDSYSSGDGLTPYLAGGAGCDRSPEAYPEVAASRLGGHPLRFVACAGAAIAQVAGQVSSLPAATLGRAAITTVTAGGNDLPFSGLITSCVGVVTSTAPPLFKYVSGASGAATCAGAIAHAASLLGADFDPVTGGLTMSPSATAVPLSDPSTIESRLTALYTQILRAEGAPLHRLGGPRLIVVAYPTLLRDPTSGPCRLSAAPLPAGSFAGDAGAGAPLYPAFSAPITLELAGVNAVLQAEVDVVVRSLRHRGYLDVSLAPAAGFVGLDCATGASPDLNGVLLTGTTTTLQSGSFHPTAAGQAALATSVVAAWRSAQHAG
jgi:hypothetical protein